MAIINAAYLDCDNCAALAFNQMCGSTIETYGFRLDEQSSLIQHLCLHGTNWIGSFSSRQSYPTDLINAANNESPFFPQLLVEIVKPLVNRHKLPVTLDKKMLSDITRVQNKKGVVWEGGIGKTFEYIVKCADNCEGDLQEPLDCYFDELKTTLTYMQAHRLASLNPGDTINLRLYDDRQDDILETNHDLFLRHPDLLPHNVTLFFYRYGYESEHKNDLINGPKLFKTSIKGTGLINRAHDELYIRYLLSQAGSNRRCFPFASILNHRGFKFQHNRLGQKVKIPLTKEGIEQYDVGSINPRLELTLCNVICDEHKRIHQPKAQPQKSESAPLLGEQNEPTARSWFCCC